MAQLYAKKASDGQPKALECTDEGLLKVDTEITATLDPTGLATQTTLAAVLAKLSADPATQTTLAAILAKIIAAPASEAKQDSIIAKLPDQSGGKVPVTGPLTDAELAARDPATSAKQDTGNANLSSIDGKLPDQISSRVPVDCHLSEVLSYLLDSIDVAKMSKGAVTTAHNAITATATSAEIDCRGFNSLLVHWVSDQTDKTWTISVTGATGSGLTFVPLLDKATGLAASEITTDISGFFVISNIPDYIKIVCTEVDDGATVTCKVQPFNS